MAGFGYGPFGKGPFGRSSWGRSVLWGAVPGEHRDQDAANGGVLEGFLRALAAPLDEAASRASRFDRLLDPAFDPESLTPPVKLEFGREVPSLGDPIRSGLDGRADGTGRVTAPSARFSEADLGRVFEATPASGPKRYATIVSVTSMSEAVTMPAIPEGRYRWSIRSASPSEGRSAWEVLWSDGVEDLRPGWIVRDGNQTRRVIGRRLLPALGEDARPAKKEGSDGRLIADPFNPDRVYLTSAQTAFDAWDVGSVAVIPATKTRQAARWRIDAVLSPPRLASILADWEWASMSPGWEFEGLESGWEYEHFFEGDEYGIELTDERSGIPPPTLKGPTWFAILPPATVILEGEDPPGGYAERSGEDLRVVDVLESNQIRASILSGRFSSHDIGKELVVYGFDEGQGSRAEWTISMIESPSSIIVSNVSCIPGGSQLRWYVRSRVETTAHPPSFTEHLAGNFDLDVWPSEDADSARRWVASAPYWATRKGSEAAYRAVALACGVDARVEGLWEIGPQHLEGLTSSSYELGERPPIVSRKELGGKARIGSIRDERTVSIESPGLRSRHIGRSIFFGADDYEPVGWAENLVRGTIVGREGSSFLVEIFGGTAQPEVVAWISNGADIPFGVFRVLTTRSPLAVFLDDLPVDVVPADGYAWEVGEIAVEGECVGVRQVEEGLWEFEVEAGSDLIGGVDGWVLEADGQRNVLESRPLHIREGVWNVQAGPHSLREGAVRFRYEGILRPDASFSRAAAVIADLTPLEGGEDGGPDAIAKALTRLREVTPAHVTLIPRVALEVEAHHGGVRVVAESGVGYAIDVAVARSNTSFDGAMPADLIELDPSPRTFDEGATDSVDLDGVPIPDVEIEVPRSIIAEPLLLEDEALLLLEDGETPLLLDG